MTFTPLLREGKHMSNLTTFLDRLEKKTEEICELNEIRKQLEARHRAFQSAIYTAFNSPPKTSESAEDYVRRMAADKTSLEGRRRELVAITTAIDEIPLPRPADESHEQYILRLGDYIRAVSSALQELGPCDGETIADSIHRVRRERNNAERKMADLADSHARTIEQANAKIAKLETRESELNDLHDAIESLPGFPMQPPETYAEYLQRLAAANKLNDERATAMDGHLQAIEKAILKADAFRKWPKESYAEYITRLAADRARLAAELEHLTASTQETTQRLRDQLDGNNQQYAESRATIANLEAQLAEASKERDNFRARWEESLAERDRATDEARRTSEANQAMQGDITMHRAVLSRILMEKGASQLLHGMEWNDAARKVLFEAGAMVGDTGKPSA